MTSTTISLYVAKKPCIHLLLYVSVLVVDKPCIHLLLYVSVLVADKPCIHLPLYVSVLVAENQCTPFTVVCLPVLVADKPCIHLLLYVSVSGGGQTVHPFTVVFLSTGGGQTVHPFTVVCLSTAGGQTVHPFTVVCLSTGGGQTVHPFTVILEEFIGSSHRRLNLKRKFDVSENGETGSEDKRCVKGRLLSISDIDEHEVTFNIIATKVQRSTDTGNQDGHCRICHPIKKGADVNQRSMITYDLTDDVCIAGNVQIVKILLRKGADINATGVFDYSPLILAAQYSRDRVVSTLLQDCADVNKISDVDGKNALIVAIECNNCDFVNTLLWYGANVNYSNPLHRRGTTALILATRLGYRDIVEAPD
ncbi:hypothetical protein Btru_072935 [Bulinus truncatus]|nr:hypothetical protein Btru_072935 [Bulinus truncatus]